MSESSLVNPELVASVECHSIINAGKRKKTFIRLVHIPANDLSKKRISLAPGSGVITGAALRKSSGDGVNSPFVFCGANLELYDCLRLGKRKLTNVFNISQLTDVAVQQNSTEKKKSNNSAVLDVRFSDSTALKLFFSEKNEDAETWCDRLTEISNEVSNYYKWQENPMFTENSAYLGAFGVTVVTEMPGVDSTKHYELKVLLECLIMKKLNDFDDPAASGNAVVMYWPITSIKRFGLHAADNHIFTIEYTEPDSESNEPVSCVFRSAFAVSLVTQISKRVQALNSVDIGNVYSDVETQNRKSELGELRAARSMNSMNENGGSDLAVPPKKFLDSNGDIYSSFSDSEPEADSALDGYLMSNNDAAEEAQNEQYQDVNKPEYHVIDYHADRQEASQPEDIQYATQDELHYNSVDIVNISPEPQDATSSTKSSEFQGSISLSKYEFQKVKAKFSNPNNPSQSRTLSPNHKIHNTGSQKMDDHQANDQSPQNANDNHDSNESAIKGVVSAALTDKNPLTAESSNKTTPNTSPEPPPLKPRPKSLKKANTSPKIVANLVETYKL